MTPKFCEPKFVNGGDISMKAMKANFVFGGLTPKPEVEFAKF